MNKSSAVDPIVIERVADGDDITIEPDAPRAKPRRGRRTIIGAIVAVVLIAGVSAAIATRHQSHNKNSGAHNLRSLAPASPPAAHPTPAGRVVKPKPVPAQPVPAKGPLRKNTTPVAVNPPASVATPPPATPATSPPPAPVTAPPVATPPAEPPSVLRWTATPPALTVKGGAQASVVITVVNPTKGTVTLGTPLSCAPLLRGPHGAVIGATVCEQTTQLMSPHSSLTQRFTIYATDTADSSGHALAPGVYTASFENLFKIKVNVTAA